VKRTLLAGAVLAALVVVPAAPASAELGAACPPGSVPGGAFDDVDADGPGPAIDCVYWHGITGGTTTLTFAPSHIVRRDQGAALLARTVETAGAGLPAPADQGFADIAGSPHRDRIDQLAAAGVVSGTSATTYTPLGPEHRDQMATLLVRTYEHVTGVELAQGDHPFVDVAGNAHEEAIAKAVVAGFTEGVSAETYRPRELVRRDQMARFIARMLDKLVADGHAAPRPGGFEGRARPLPDDIRAFMTGRSWRAGCPVGLDGLALLEVTYHGFDERPHWGRMVVAASVAQPTVEALRRLHDARFPLARMRLVDHYGADDDASMDDNNTSAFNCRRVTGGSSWSEHSYGTAIDVNPVQNPYVRDSTVLPAAGGDYLDRNSVRPGMIVRPGPVTDAFAAMGWGWGGDFRSLRDFMHFSQSGR
jgi:hypothetical protein